MTFATQGRLAGQEVGAQNLPAFVRGSLATGVTFLTDRYLLGVAKSRNGLAARLRNRHTCGTEEISVDAVVVDQGVEADSTLFDALAPKARNGGDMDMNAYADGPPQPECEDGGLVLHRIGDALRSRNLHAAIFDARRICRTL